MKQTDRRTQQNVVITKSLIVVVLVCCICHSKVEIQGSAGQPSQQQLEQLSQSLTQNWAFVSQIRLTWFKDLVQHYFQNCREHPQLQVYYDCNTSLSNYKMFWEEFLEMVYDIKFSRADSPPFDRQEWKEMMKDAVRDFILVEKSKTTIQLEDLYEDIKQFPHNLIGYLYYLPDYEGEATQLKEIVKHKPKEIFFQTHVGKSKEQMQKDVQLLYRDYFDYAGCLYHENVGSTNNFMQECKIPVLRYAYFLRDLFVYYFEQPKSQVQRSVMRDYDHKEDTGPDSNKGGEKNVGKETLIVLKPSFIRKLTALWRNMVPAIQRHLEIGQQISLGEVQEHSVPILQAVIQLLKSQSQEQEDSQGVQNIGQDWGNFNDKGDQEPTVDAQEL